MDFFLFWTLLRNCEQEAEETELFIMTKNGIIYDEKNNFLNFCVVREVPIHWIQKYNVTNLIHEFLNISISLEEI